MKQVLILFALMFSMGVIGSETDSAHFNFDGSRGQRSLALSTETYRTEYRYVQVPYTERVCRTETRYRRECRMRPGRRVCRNQPGRRVCRRRPDGRRVCHTQPGRRVCRTEPGRRVCRRIPYNERVCRNETRYRQERRAYTVTDTRTDANLTFTFSERAFELLGINVEVRAHLNRDHLSVHTRDYSTPGMLIADQVTRNRYGSRDNLRITENHHIDLFNSERLFSPLRGEIQVDDLINGELIIFMDRIHYRDEINFDLTVKKEGQILISRALNRADYNLRERNGRSVLSLNLGSLGVYAPEGTQLDFNFGMVLNSSNYINADQYDGWRKVHHFSKVTR